MATFFLAAVVALWAMGVVLIFAGIAYITYQIAKG